MKWRTDFQYFGLKNSTINIASSHNLFRFTHPCLRIFSTFSMHFHCISKKLCDEWIYDFLLWICFIWPISHFRKGIRFTQLSLDFVTTKLGFYTSVCRGESCSSRPADQFPSIDKGSTVARSLGRAGGGRSFRCTPRRVTAVLSTVAAKPRIF